MRESKSSFFSDLIKAIKENPYISDHNAGCAVGEYLKIAFAPFYLSLIFGWIVVTSSDKWSQVFMSAINEFMQLTGIKILLYLTVTVLGLSLTLYRFKCLTKFMSWLTKTLSHSGFAMSAVAFGVLWGILTPAMYDSGSVYNPLVITLMLSLFFIFTNFVFYISSHIFKSGVRDEINKTLGNHTNKITFVIGLGLLALSFYSFFIDEEWKGAIKDNVSACQKEQN